MTRSLHLPGILLLTVAAAGCNATAACDAEADSLTCYCAENPENCTDEAESITSSTPETLVR